MEVAFDDLKYLVTVVADDLLKDDFGNFQNGLSGDSVDKFDTEVSNEMYDKVHLLQGLLSELLKYRPLSI